ncbi:hypothetical protein [uncultured Prevotella sp.]|uniref:hypothetical protein n=1 Tax=uncultured Prevotella sp. TaxID=159272 RepID=UPI00258C850F|nr:hypothetical protein [uncultured Prevotella sp.]
MKKNYVKPSVKVREIDMESLLASQSGENAISNTFPTNIVDGSDPTYGGLSNGTQTVSAGQNLWSEEEE